MSAEKIIQTLANLSQVQVSLLQLAREKTNILKNGDMAKLDQLLKKEEKIVKLLEEAEEKRHTAVQQFLTGKGIVNENVTLTELYKLVGKDDREQMTELQEKLMGDITALKQQNELNQELMTQSLQFVNLSLEMLAPETSIGTYGRLDNKQEANNNHGSSIFDSKA